MHFAHALDISSGRESKWNITDICLGNRQIHSVAVRILYFLSIVFELLDRTVRTP